MWIDVDIMDDAWLMVMLYSFRMGVEASHVHDHQVEDGTLVYVVTPWYPPENSWFAVENSLFMVELPIKHGDFPDQTVRFAKG